MVRVASPALKLTRKPRTVSGSCISAIAVRIRWIIATALSIDRVIGNGGEHGTVSEARRLWSAIDKPNVMIKVPATASGLLAIRQLIAAGVSVNAALIFGTRRYREVVEAYSLGLEDRLAENRPLEHVASVASLSVSPIDALVDRKLDAIQHPEKIARAQQLRGRVAIALARLAYQEYKSLIASQRWQPLAAHNAQTQRILSARFARVSLLDRTSVLQVVDGRVPSVSAWDPQAIGLPQSKRSDRANPAARNARCRIPVRQACASYRSRCICNNGFCAQTSGSMYEKMHNHIFDN